MEREPSYYSRLLVAAGLFPLLALELFVGLPDGAFVAAGAAIFAAAAGIHYAGGEVRAAVGWLSFGAALGLSAVVDVTANQAFLLTFGALLAVGLLLLVSQRAATYRERET